jgi:hypothetical protein
MQDRSSCYVNNKVVSKTTTYRLMWNNPKSTKFCLRKLDFKFHATGIKGIHGNGREGTDGREEKRKEGERNPR